MPKYMTVSEAARNLGEQYDVIVPPRAISDLFYQRELRDDLCPLVGGRRLIPRDYLPTITAALRKRGLIQMQEEKNG